MGEKLVNRELGSGSVYTLACVFLCLKKETDDEKIYSDTNLKSRLWFLQEIGSAAQQRKAFSHCIHISSMRPFIFFSTFKRLPLGGIAIFPLNALFLGHHRGPGGHLGRDWDNCRGM